MPIQKGTAEAYSNIAFVKYWGNRDGALRIPLNNSISMNLDHATTTTTVAFDAHLEADVITIGGAETRNAAHVLAAVRSVNRLELVGETMRQALNELAATVSEWLKGIAPAE